MRSRVYKTARCPSVRPSVCSTRSPNAATVGLLLWSRRARDIYRLLQQRRANAGSATLSAYLGSYINTDLLLMSYSDTASTTCVIHHTTAWQAVCVGVHGRHGTGSHFVTHRPTDPGIQRPGDPVDPVTLFFNKLQMSTYV